MQQDVQDLHVPICVSYPECIVWHIYGKCSLVWAGQSRCWPGFCEQVGDADPSWWLLCATYRCIYLTNCRVPLLAACLHCPANDPRQLEWQQWPDSPVATYAHTSYRQSCGLVRLHTTLKRVVENFWIGVRSQSSSVSENKSANCCIALSVDIEKSLASFIAFSTSMITLLRRRFS